MPSLRSQSVKKSLSPDLTPVRSHTLEHGAPGKVDHFAYIARLVHQSAENFLHNTELAAAIGTTTTINQLNKLFIDQLYDHTMEVWLSPEFAEVRALLEASQAERQKIDSHVHPTIDWSINGGVHTYVNSVDGTYALLREAFGTESAAHPGNAAIPHQLSLLNVDQFVPYKGTYLDQSSTINPNPHLDQFVAQIELAPNGSWRFKEGYPEEAEVPFALTLPEAMYTYDDYSLRPGLTIKVGDIPITRPTVGCPFTFDTKQGRDMWELYASARQRIHHHQELSRAAFSSGDSAASLPKTS